MFGFGKQANGKRKPAAAIEPDRSFRLGSRVLAGTLLGFLLVGGAGGWAATAQLAGAVIAHGVVKVDENLKAIQHRDGGIVSEIAIKEGDFVAEGQVLLRLDDVQTRAELSIVRTQQMELKGRKARLVAERDLLEAIEFPAEMTNGAAAFAEISRGETRLFDGNARNRASQKEQLALGIEQLGEEINGMEAQQASKRDEIGLVQKEHDKVKALADKRIIDSSRVYLADRELARLKGELGEIDAGIARAKVRMSEIRIQIIAIDETARTEAQQELSVVDQKLSELNEQRFAIEDRLSRTDIRAPLSGTINELSVHTVGGVITPAEQLATIVPADATLKVEARLSPTDIDQISVGQPARLRFASFNQRTTPELNGEIAYVSAATSADRSTGQVYYVATVAVSPDELAKLEDNKLLPGMPVEVYLTTAERTAMSYLSKPFADQFSRAFREQ
jgi:HlyD family secretion protein